MNSHDAIAEQGSTLFDGVTPRDTTKNYSLGSTNLPIRQSGIFGMLTLNSRQSRFVLLGRHYIQLLVAVALYAGFVCATNAATLIPNFETDKHAPPEALSNILIRGPIERGDAERLARLIGKYAVRRHPLNFLLDSPGGAVDEALKISRLVEMLMGSTQVDNSQTMAINSSENRFICASACFFIYVSGAVRRPPLDSDFGRIGIHRPYFSIAPSANIRQELAMHDSTLASVRDFLEAKKVPARLIEMAFSRSSQEIYWLNGRDAIDLGFVDPGLEELAIRECRYQPEVLRRSYERTNTDPPYSVGKSMTCLNEKLMPTIAAAYERIAKGARPW